uniref:Uncharacterized protein n=1 Tax=Acrobeloides nanus TaxID=290746 RepID=A0A914EHS4_9BILA
MPLTIDFSQHKAVLFNPLHLVDQGQPEEAPDGQLERPQGDPPVDVPRLTAILLRVLRRCHGLGTLLWNARLLPHDDLQPKIKEALRHEFADSAAHHPH